MSSQSNTLLFLIVASICCIIQCRAAKVYKRCELARELLTVHELPKDQIGTWVCIARHESEYNTSAINKGSGDHGLFQISELFWCSPPGAACGVSCDSLKDDDIEDDVVCARRIFRQHQRLHGNGFLAWVVYNQHCKNAQGFVDDCWAAQDNSLTKDAIAEQAEIKEQGERNKEKVIDSIVDSEDEVVKQDADECNFNNEDAKSIKKNCKKTTALPKVEENKGRTMKFGDNYEYASTANGFKLIFKKSGQ